VVRLAEEHHGVIGLFLGGSRGKGWGDVRSDYDVWVVLRDGAESPLPIGHTLDFRGLDLWVVTQTALRAYASWDTPERWDRYSFAHVRALIDKTGEIQPLIDEKGTVPDIYRQSFTAGRLDAYLNAFYRSARAAMRGDGFSQHLQAAQSIAPLLDALFALEGKIAPYADYIERELQNYPLKAVTLPSGLVLHCLRKITATGDLATQQLLARAVETHFRTLGFAKVFDDWGRGLAAALEFKPAP
jgi:hypothetical protein